MRYLHLIRHGRTDWNSSGRLTSFTEVPLNESGYAQCDDLARHLNAELPIAEFWAAPLVRATATAAILNSGRTYDLRVADDAVEVNFGVFEGKTPGDLQDESLGALHRRWHSGVGEIVGVESFDQAASRATRLLEKLAVQSEQENVCLVTHGVFLRVFLCVNVLGMRAHEYKRLLVDNASVSTVRFDALGARLIRLNFCPNGLG